MIFFNIDHTDSKEVYFCNVSTRLYAFSMNMHSNLYKIRPKSKVKVDVRESATLPHFDGGQIDQSTA